MSILHIALIVNMVQLKLISFRIVSNQSIIYVCFLC